MATDKCYLSHEKIRELYNYAFKKNSDNIQIKNLSGGVKSAVYSIQDVHEMKILKIAPKNDTTTLTIDKNTFWWEIKMLQLMEKIEIPTPRVLFYDDSCEICSVPYFFMTHISGVNLLECKSSLSQEQIEKIEYQIGKISSQICSVTSKDFFLPSAPKKNLEIIIILFHTFLNCY